MKVLRESRFLESQPIQLDELGEVGTHFMTWRLLRELPVSPVWEEIRLLARAVGECCDNSEETYKIYVSLLCRKVNRGTHLSVLGLCDPLTSRGSLFLPDNPTLRFEHDLVRAAIYTRHLSIVEERMDSLELRKLWREDADAFCELCVAGAEANNGPALDLIVEVLDIEHKQRWQACYATYLSLNGDVNMLEEAFSRTAARLQPARQLELNKILNALKVELVLLWWRFFTGHSLHPERPGWPSYCAAMDETNELAIEVLMHTPKPDNFDTLRAARSQAHLPDINQAFWVKLLENACHENWEEMVRYLLDLGAHISTPYMKTPLKRACARGNIEIARLLLKEGAVIDCDTMNMTARAGHWRLVRLMADEYGAINKNRRGMMMWVVRQERTALYLDLVERDGPLCRGDWDMILKRAEAEGLNSMVELLKETHPYYDIPPSGFVGDSVLSRIDRTQPKRAEEPRPVGRFDSPHRSVFESPLGRSQSNAGHLWFFHRAGQ
jgi:hypothetical protein